MAETKMKDVALNPTLSKDQSSVVNLVDAPTGTGAKHAQPLSAREKFEKAVNEGRMPNLKFTAQHFKTAWKAEDVEAEIPMLQERASSMGGGVSSGSFCFQAPDRIVLFLSYA